MTLPVAERVELCAPVCCSVLMQCSCMNLRIDFPNTISCSNLYPKQIGWWLSVLMGAQKRTHPLYAIDGYNIYTLCNDAIMSRHKNNFVSSKLSMLMLPTFNCWKTWAQHHIRFWFGKCLAMCACCTFVLTIQRCNRSCLRPCALATIDWWFTFAAPPHKEKDHKYNIRNFRWSCRPITGLLLLLAYYIKHVTRCVVSLHITSFCEH